MAFSDLTQPESLRPWTALGLRHLLNDPVPQEPSVADSAPAADSAVTAAEPQATSVPALSPQAVQAWAKLLSRPSEPAACILTYWELALDMCGYADATRRGFLRELLATLAQPRGTISFFPVGVATGQGEPVIETSLEHFNRAVTEAAASAIICMGRRCAEVLGLDDSFQPYSSQDGPDRKIIFLPELPELLADSNSPSQLADFILARLAA